EANRGRLMGFFSGGQRAGSVIGVLLGGLLFDLTGRATSFFIIAALGLVSLLAPLALGRGHPVPSEMTEAVRRPAAPTATASGRGRGRIWDLLVSPVPELTTGQLHRLFAADMTFFAFHLILNGVLVATLGFYLNQELGDGVTISGVLIGVATLNGVLLATDWLATMAGPYLGHLGDRFGRERVLLTAAPICLISLLLLTYPPLLWIAIFWLPLAFVAAASSLTALDALVGGLAPVHRRSQVMSRYATWQDIGSAIGPLLAYVVIGFASLTWVYLGGAILLAGAFALFIATFRGAVAAEA
ncbi:MAG: MFS transporter, partial [Dehalococcoidia bacterium]